MFSLAGRDEDFYIDICNVDDLFISLLIKEIFHLNLQHDISLLKKLLLVIYKITSVNYYDHPSRSLANVTIV